MTTMTAQPGSAILLPESLAAEAAVLSSMVIEVACIAQVTQIVKAETFFRIGMRLLFEPIVVADISLRAIFSLVEPGLFAYNSSAGTIRTTWQDAIVI